MAHTHDTGTNNRLLAIRWISALFARELTSGDVESYRNGDGKTMLDALSAHFPDFAEFTQIQTVLNGQQTSDDAALDFAGAYSWLFHGVGGARSAPPHQHDWSEDSDGSQMRSIAQCMELMSACDIAPSEDSGESADHISIQLEFFGYLDERSASDPDGPWSEYRDRLVRDHMNVWLPLFLTACERNDQSGLYSALASLTRRFVPISRQGDSEHTLTANVG